MRLKEKLTLDQQQLLTSAKPHSKYGAVKELVLTYLDGNPGSDIAQIARFLKKDSTRASSMLLAYARRGQISRKKLDGKWRYYAKNYKFAGEPVKVPQSGFYERIPEVRFHSATLEKFAMEWSWESQSDSLRDFIKWYKENK